MLLSRRLVSNGDDEVLADLKPSLIVELGNGSEPHGQVKQVWSDQPKFDVQLEDLEKWQNNLPLSH